MPRNGSGVYSKVPGTEAVSGQAASSSDYNAQVDDLVADANAARPIVAGGTGAATAAAARTNLGAQEQDALLDDFVAQGGLGSLGTASAEDFTDDDDLAVDPGNVGSRGNMAAAIGAAVNALAVDQGDWNTGTSTDEGTITPAKLAAVFDAVLPETFESGAQTITANTLLTVAHGLSATPRHFHGSLECVTTQAGYAVGDFLNYDLVYQSTSTSDVGCACWADATNVYVRFSGTPLATYTTSGVFTSLTPGNFNLHITATV